MNECLIKILPAEIQFKATLDSTILDAALKNDLFLQHSCKKGQCGVCAAEVLSGQVKNELGEIVSSGEVLTCCSYAQNDVSLKANYFSELVGLECKTLPCKVAHYELVADDILILTLRLPPTAEFNYVSGQYIDLSYQGVRRSYSIANSLHRKEGIELHIRMLPDGELSHLLSKTALNQLMRLEGPKGTFFVRHADNPLIFLAGGTGFAPVKAMVESLLVAGDARDIHIYWGMPHSKSLYTDVAEHWTLNHPQITYVPVISETDLGWAGRRGFVHEAVLEDFANLEPYHVYACGSTPMLEAAEKAFVSHGLLKEHFYKDAFVSSN